MDFYSILLVKLAFAFSCLILQDFFQETFNSDGQNFSACLLPNKVNLCIVKADVLEKEMKTKQTCCLFFSLEKRIVTSSVCQLSCWFTDTWHYTFGYT